MMDTEEKYKVVIIDDERSASDALRRELEPYREFEIKGKGNCKQWCKREKDDYGVASGFTLS